MWWLMSLTIQSLRPHYLTFSFTPLNSSFGIWIFSSHVVAYIVSFDSSSGTQKSDIIRPRYHVFIACGGSCLYLCSLLHNITLAFHTLNSSFGIWIFSSYVVAYLVSFDSRFETRKSDIIRPRYELFNACLIMSLTTLSLTLCYIFIHSIQLEFRNLDFFIPCRSLSRKL